MIADCKGDIQRGLEVIEFACGIPHVLKGEYTQGAGPGIDVYSMRQPLGVGAGITPFNFPAMIPMWMFGVADRRAATPSSSSRRERDPSVPVRLAELMLRGGAARGHPAGRPRRQGDGRRDPRSSRRSRAVSFVGSSDIAHYVYQRGVAAGKRVQAMGGAKNHGIVMPDADLDQVVDDLSGAAFGSAGERCMALPVVVPVGEKTADALREKLIPAIAALRVGVSTDADAHYGPVVNAAHKAAGRELDPDRASTRAPSWSSTAAASRCRAMRRASSSARRCSTTSRPTMRTYKEEIFGPVLQIVRADDFEEALRLPSEHQYGNGVAIFTRNGHAAREFAARVNVGMVGINVPIPVPVAYHTFGGWKRSAFGDTNQHGMEGVKFWTKVKTDHAALAGRRRCRRWPRMAGRRAITTRSSSRRWGDRACASVRRPDDRPEPRCDGRALVPAYAWMTAAERIEARSRRDRARRIAGFDQFDAPGATPFELLLRVDGARSMRNLEPDEPLTRHR